MASTPSPDSVLDEIRSTIASFESLRTAASARRKELSLPPAVVSVVNGSASVAKPVTVHTEPVRSDTTRPSAGQTTAGTTSEDRFEQHTDQTSGPASPGSGSAASSNEPGRIADLIPDLSTDDADEPERELVDSYREPALRSTVALRSLDKTARIMIVDDEPLNIMTFRQHLKMEGYEHFVTTSNAREAIHLLRSERPDVLLLDIRMPEISGMDILRVISLDPVLQHIPVLILTAAADPATRKQALDLGASDFLQKPIDPNELLPRVRNAIVIKKHYDMAASEAQRLEQQVERRTRQLEATRQQLILCLARAAEHRDNDTGNHVIRVGRYTSIIARKLDYPEHKLDMLEQAAQLHDVGKIGIPDSILFKPDRLAPDEYELMKKHCALGKQIIEPVSEKDWSILKTHTRIGESMLHVRSSPLLMLAARIAQTHHEHWNGKGYPLGLMGADIPLEGRIVAVADVFDALSSRRPYKEPFPRQKCFDILAAGRGAQFDPTVIDAFFECAEEIIDVQLQLMDDEDRIPRSQWEVVAAEAIVGTPHELRPPR